jgi:pimeloyl-ACP methyl ester carboxylesterase
MRNAPVYSAASGHQDTLICLHGSASSPRQWQQLGERLGPRYRVIAPGLLGYSDGPPWSAERPLTLDEEAAWIERWLDGAGAPVHLVGHSYGGAVALKVAQRRPERVRSLILYEPVLFRLLTGEVLSDIVALANEVERACQAGEPATAGRIFVDYWSGQGTWQRMPAAQQGAVAQRMHKVAAEFHAVFADGTPASGYARLPMPILFLSGTLTRPPTARIARVVQSFMPNASRIEMPGLGHLGPISHPDAVNALVALFLDSLQRDSGVQRQAELAQAA